MMSDSNGDVRADGLIVQRHGGALRPPWGPGENPRGRRGPQGGASIVQWCRVFVTEPKYGGPKGFLRIAKRARHGKTQAEQIAARRVLRARRMKSSRAGRPLAHDDLEGLLDRDLGKPTQSIQVEATVQTLDEAEADLIAVFRADRSLLLTILDRLTAQLPGLREGILERFGVTAPAVLPAGEMDMAEVDEGVVKRGTGLAVPRAYGPPRPTPTVTPARLAKSKSAYQQKAPWRRATGPNLSSS